MNQKGTFAKKHRPSYRMQVVLSYCLAVLFGFLFTFGIPKLSNAQPGKIQRDTSVVANDNHIASGHHTGDLPIPTPIEPEFPDDSESNDSFHDALSKLCWSPHLEININPSAVRSLLLQLTLAIQGRPKVSLFILHHSWKSYLS